MDSTPFPLLDIDPAATLSATQPFFNGLLERELGFLEADALGERARAEHLAEEVRRLSFADCAG